MIVLVTGAAGLLGGALVADLVARGHGVIGLVHRQTDISGNDGVAIPAPRFAATAPSAGQVVSLQCDIRLPGLGLDEATRSQLRGMVDVVIHSAALVQFEADARDLAAVNVDGTRHVAAAFASSRIIHVSTAYVCGLRDGPIAEAACDPDGGFGNGYEASKARAEAVLHTMRPDAIIVRPSIIVGEWESGRIRSFDTIYRAFRLIAEGRVGRLVVSPQASLDFVPVDHVTRSIADLVACPEAEGAIVHLVAERPVEAARFLSLISGIGGHGGQNEGALDEADRRYFGVAMRLGEPYWQYFRRNPRFVSGRLAELTGSAPPLIDDAAVLRQIDYCIACGFIRTGAGLKQGRSRETLALSRG